MAPPGDDALVGRVLLFQLAVPSEIPGYLLGTLGYRFSRYLVVVSVGEVPYALGTVLLGESFVSREEIFRLDENPRWNSRVRPTAPVT